MNEIALNADQLEKLGVSVYEILGEKLAFEALVITHDGTDSGKVSLRLSAGSEYQFERLENQAQLLFVAVQEQLEELGGPPLGKSFSRVNGKSLDTPRDFLQP